MIGFYKDKAMTRPLNQYQPKYILASNEGGFKDDVVWLGDPYKSALSAIAHPGNTSLSLVDTSEFLPSGTVLLGDVRLTYTSKTQSQLLGVSGFTETYAVGTPVYPGTKYVNNVIGVFPEANPNSSLLIQVSVGGIFPYYGLPSYFSQTTLYIGQAVPIYLQFNIPAGISEITNWGVFVNNLYIRDFSDSTAPSSTEYAVRPYMAGVIVQNSTSINLCAEIFPASRAIPSKFPGFTFGKYRWRDSTNLNSVALVPPNWDLDPNEIGLEKFVPGIGYGLDLNIVGLEQSENSIYPIINSGEYFTGAWRYYYPSSPVLTAVAASTAVSVTLPTSPLPTSPIFVGNYYMDGEGYFDRSIQYTYIGITTNEDGSVRTDLPEYYFTLNRVTNVLTLNTAVPNTDLVVGYTSGNNQDIFLMPLYPVTQVQSVYTYNVDGSRNYISNYIYNADNFNLIITNPNISGIAIPGTSIGTPVYVSCQPSVVIIYDEGSPNNTWVETSINVNPAFAGISSGYIYLEHRQQMPNSISITCDKPIVDLPNSDGYGSGIVAYGPVFFGDDYALITLTVYSAVPGEVLSNIELQAQVTPQFQGYLNYTDPTSSPVYVTTGGDGKANVLYTPSSNLGYYIPASSLGGSPSNTRILLPTPIPIDLVYDSIDGWYIDLYLVYNNDPIYGDVNATVANGEVAFVSTGTPGTVGYKTNGSRQIWTVSGSIKKPVTALDSNLTPFTSSEFNGFVSYLVYNTAIPTGSTISDYYVTPRTEVLVSFISVQEPSVSSLPILIQLGPPPIINENPWLYIQDSVQGFINQFRLGYIPQISNSI